MPALRDSEPVERPVEQTNRELDRFLRARRGGDGIARLRLHVATIVSSPMDGVSHDREVRIEACGSCAENREIEIAWTSEPPVVFPRFRGVLAVRSHEDPRQSYIELYGSYAPPVAASGQPFDATIGLEIARATAREFLSDLKHAIEHQAA